MIYTYNITKERRNTMKTYCKDCLALQMFDDPTDAFGVLESICIRCIEKIPSPLQVLDIHEVINDCGISLPTTNNQ